MAAHPVQVEPLVAGFRLEPFSARHADVIASWAGDPLEAFWLAPRTAPPLSPAKVIGWGGYGREQLILDHPDQPAPVGYGEVNILPGAPGEYWLGHLVIDPNWRGRRLGTRLTALLLERAFTRHHAERVSLVVFQDNHAAIKSYRSAGMRDAGFERHYFGVYRRWALLLRMAASARS